MRIFQLVLILSLSFTSQTWASKPKSSKVKSSSSIALKNYRELFGALTVATRVDPTLPEIANYYQQVIGQLPRYGTLVEFNAQSLIASMGLAGVFCKRVIYQDAELNVPKSGLNTGIDFTKDSTKVTDAALATLIKNYSSAFLQRDPTATEQTMLSGIFRNLGAADPTAAGTRAAVLSVCSGIAGSFEFLAN